jgi:uncharacterized protein (TIGR02265 family)
MKGSNHSPIRTVERTTRFAAEHAVLEAWIEETPQNATVKGMYVDSLLSMLERTGAPRVTDKRYFSFKEYPLRDAMRIMVDTVAVMYPNSPPREGLVRVGRQVFPTLAASTVGKVLFSVAGRSWERSLKLTSKAYEVSITPGTAALAELTDRSARIELRSIWNFADTYQVGVMQGAMETLGVRGSVRAVMLGRRCDVDLILEWEPATGT